MEDALYRKMNDHSHSSSTYHKKDGTAVRAKLEQELIKEVKSAELLNEIEYRESQGPYTCRSCTGGTWNDDDLCEYCVDGFEKDGLL